MKHIHFDIEKDGFYGAYWKCKNKTDAGVIAMLGDDPEDYLAKKCVKWLNNLGFNVLTMSPGKKDYSHHNYPLERIEKAISFLKENDNKKIGIIGASTTGTLALTSASYFSDISLTIAFTPSDFIWQGFAQGNKDGCKEWPIDGESLFTYHNIPLPYMPFCYQHPEYCKMFKEECKSTGNVAASRRIFDDSELAHPIKEEEFIKIENIAKWTKTDTDVSEFTFEAEDTDLTDKSGPSWSGTAEERSMIQFVEGIGASGNRFVGYQYQKDCSLEFYIASDVAVDNAVLKISIASEIGDFTLDSDKYQIKVNGTVVPYTPINLESPGINQKGQFATYTIGNISLKAGENFIQLVTNNSATFQGATYKAYAPMVDCLKIETDAILYWDEVHGLPAANY